MFRIIADEIQYERRAVAFFLPNIGATFRDRAQGGSEALNAPRQARPRAD